MLAQKKENLISKSIKDVKNMWTDNQSSQKLIFQLEGEHNFLRLELEGGALGAAD